VVLTEGGSKKGRKSDKGKGREGERARERTLSLGSHHRQGDRATSCARGQCTHLCTRTDMSQTVRACTTSRVLVVKTKTKRTGPVKK